MWRLRYHLAGTCETGAAFAAPLIKRLAPETRFVTVRRPVAHVLASLARLGLTGLESEMRQRDAQLDAIERDPECLRIDYDDLGRPGPCADIYEFCTGLARDAQWWAALAPLNIQVDMTRQLALLQINAERIVALKAQVAEMMADV